MTVLQSALITAFRKIKYFRIQMVDGYMRVQNVKLGPSHIIKRKLMGTLDTDKMDKTICILLLLYLDKICESVRSPRHEG